MKAAALIGVLTVSLHTIFLFSLTFPTARTHHVVFEEIGEMAGSALLHSRCGSGKYFRPTPIRR